MIEPIRHALLQTAGRDTLRPVAGVAVVDGQGRLALVYSSYGGQGWHFPKGGIDEHETPIEAALKELAEEAGLVARPVSERLFPVRGGTFTQTLGFGSPRIQPANQIHHPLCDYFGRPVQIQAGPPTANHISLGALLALRSAADQAGLPAHDFADMRYQVFDACHRERVLWRQQPVYLVASLTGSDPSLLTGETEAVRWWRMDELTGADSPVHRHVKELVALPDFQELVNQAGRQGHSGP